MTTKDKENKDFVIETPGFRVNYKFLRLRTSFNGLLRNGSVRTGRDRSQMAPCISTILHSVISREIKQHCCTVRNVLPDFTVCD